MTELAGWGAPSFLPPGVVRRMAQQDAHDAVAVREAEAEQEAHREELHQRALSLYAQQAEARGEMVSAVALATGQVPGRTIGAILADAVAAADREDVVSAARLHRDGNGDPEPVHVFVDEPVIQHARSATGRKIFNRARRFHEAQRAKAAAVEAERRHRDDFPLSPTVTLRSRPTSVLEARSARTGGPEPGFGPMNVPWSQVGQWLAKGWRP